MSLSILFTIVLLIGSFKLGSYNAKNPGDLAKLCRRFWAWLNSYSRS